MNAKHDLCVWLYYENVRSSTRCDKVNKIMSKAMKKQSLQTMLRFTIQLSMTIISCPQHTPTTTHFHKSKFNGSFCLSRKWDIFLSSFLPSIRSFFLRPCAYGPRMSWAGFCDRNWKRLLCNCLHSIEHYTMHCTDSANRNWYRYENLGWNSLLIACCVADWLIKLNRA